MFKQLIFVTVIFEYNVLSRILVSCYFLLDYIGVKSVLHVQLIRYSLYMLRSCYHLNTIHLDSNCCIRY